MGQGKEQVLVTRAWTTLTTLGCNLLSGADTRTGQPGLGTRGQTGDGRGESGHRQL